MADQDTTVTYENGEKANEEVETTQVEDDTSKAEHQEEVTDTGKKEDGEESTDGEEQDANAETKEETKSEFKKRFSQFEGETPEEYLKNLEEAYANSSTEGQRKAQEAKEAKERYDKVAALVANDPDFAKKLSDAEEAPKPPVDPAIQWAKEQMEAQYEKDWGSFVTEHPEVATDKELTTELIEELDAIGYAYEKRGKKLSMAEGLKKAWVSLGKDTADNKEKIVTATKEQASKGSPAAKSSSAPTKVEFTEDQIKVAKKMGLTPEQLAKYNSKK